MSPPEGDPPVRVLTCHAHAATRRGLGAALASSGLETVAEAASAGAAVAAASEQTPDLCLLDMEIPGGAVGAIERIVGATPHARVVMLAGGRHEPAEIIRVLRAGAVGYLPVETEPARLGHALRAVMRGEAAVPRRMVRSLLDELRRGGVDRRSALERAIGERFTEREWQVLELAAAGADTQAIGDRLGLSCVTVRRHSGTMLRKVGVEDRAGAVAALERAQR